LTKPLLQSSALVATLLVAGCGQDSPEPFPAEDRLLESLAEEYTTARFRFYPVESTLAGLPGQNGAFGRFTESDVASRAAWLSDFHTKLSGLNLKALSQPAYLDALWLTSLSKAEIFDLQERRLWAVSPGFYGDQIRSGLAALLLAPDLAERAQELGERLDAIPRIVDEAGENLKLVSEPWRKDGLRSLLLCSDLLAEMPLLLEQSLPAYRVAELSEKSRTAMRALQSLIASLSERPGSSGSSGEATRSEPMGEEGFAAYLRLHEMIDWPPDRVLAEARNAVSSTSSQIIEVSLEDLAERDLRRFLAEPSPGGDSAEAMAGLEEQARSFLEAISPAESPVRAIPVRIVPPYLLGRERVRLSRPSSLGPVKEAILLVNEGASGSGLDLELSTLSEVAGGYRLFLRQSESSSLIRRVFRARTAAEGWTSWLLRRALETGYRSGDPRLRLGQLHRELLEELRLEAAVSIHAYQASPAEMERRIRDTGYLSPEEAAIEIERIAVDPGAGSAALGRLLLEELSRDYLRAHPLASLADLEGACLGEGLVPFRLLRFKLLGMEPSARAQREAEPSRGARSAGGGAPAQ
jgi:hypothetical protein